MSNEIPFDLTKTYIHMEDNEDGTITFTGHKLPMIPQEGLVTMVMEGSLESVLLDFAFASPPELVEEFHKKSTIIPNEVE